MLPPKLTRQVDRLATLFHVTPKSSNSKTGPIPVTTSSASFCPVSCPFRDSGCYADGGPLAIHWRAVTNKLRGLSWEDFLAWCHGLPTGTLWRHNQAGDLPGNGTKLDAAMCMQLARNARHTRGFTYTHYPVLEGEASDATVAHNRDVIRRMNETGFTVNVSANSPSHAAKIRAAFEAYECGYIVPIATVLPESNFPRHAGKDRLTVCPAAVDDTDTINCQTCQLCQRIDRRAVIGFPAHGARRRAAAKIAAC